LEELEADDDTKHRLFNPFLRLKGIVFGFSCHPMG